MRPEWACHDGLGFSASDFQHPQGPFHFPRKFKCANKTLLWWKPRHPPEKADSTEKAPSNHGVIARPCIAPLKSRSSSYNNGILELSTLLAEGLVYRTIYDLIPDDSKSHRHLTRLNGSPLALPDPGTHHLVLFCHYDPGFLVYDSDYSASNSLRK